MTLPLAQPLTRNTLKDPGGPNPTLPDWVPPAQTPNAPRTQLERSYVPLSRRVLTVTHEDTPIPIIYGEDTIGPIMATRPVAVGGRLIMALVWCIGEIEDIEVLNSDGTPLVTSNDATRVNNYRGRIDQPVDPLLQAALPGYDDTGVVEYNGRRVGIAYSVISVSSNTTEGFPTYVARIKGKKIRDPRGYPGIISNPGITGWGDVRPPLAYQGTAANYAVGYDYVSSTGIGGTGSEAEFTFFGCFRTSQSGTIDLFSLASDRVLINKRSGGTFQVIVRDNGGTDVMHLRTVSTDFEDGEWHTFVVSYSAIQQKVHFMMDAGFEDYTEITAPAWTNADLNDLGALGYRYSSNANDWVGEIGCFGLILEYYDLTDLTEQAKFYEERDDHLKDLTDESPLLLFKDGYNQSGSSGASWSATTDPTPYDPDVPSEYTTAATASWDYYICEAYGGGVYLNILDNSNTAGIQTYLNLGSLPWTDSSPDAMNYTIYMDLEVIQGTTRHGVFSDITQEYDTSGHKVFTQDSAGGNGVQLISRAGSDVGPHEFILRRFHMWPTALDIQTDFSQWTSGLPTGWEQFGSETVEAVEGGVRFHNGATTNNTGIQYTARRLPVNSTVYFEIDITVAAGGCRLKARGGDLDFGRFSQSGRYTGTFFAYDTDSTLEFLIRNFASTTSDVTVHSVRFYTDDPPTDNVTFYSDFLTTNAAGDEPEGPWTVDGTADANNKFQTNDHLELVWDTPGTVGCTAYGVLNTGVEYNLEIVTEVVAGIPNELRLAVHGLEVAVDGRFRGTFTSTDHDLDIVTSLGAGTVELKSIKVWKVEQTVSQAFTQTPSLHLLDLYENAVYGLRQTVNQDSLFTAIAANEDRVDTGNGTELRHQIGMSLVRKQPIEDVIETIRDAAKLYIIRRNGEIHFIPNEAGSSVGSLTKDDFVKGTFKATRINRRNTPNFYRIWYTNTTTDTWFEDYVEVMTAEAAEGSVERIESSIRVPWIQSESMAIRYGTERLNTATLIIYRITGELLESAWKYEPGDIVDITHPIGFTAVDFRVLRADPINRGIRAFEAIQHDNQVYSNIIAAPQALQEIVGDSPFSPPTVTNLSVREVFYSAGTGVKSKLDITWDQPTYSYVGEYKVTISESGTVVWEGNPRVNNVCFREITAGLLYTITVTLISTVSVASPTALTTITAQGSNLAPQWGDGYISAFEVGGHIYTKVERQALDIDLWGYEWREADLNDLNETALFGNAADWDMSDYTLTALGTSSISQEDAGIEITIGSINGVTISVNDTDSPADVLGLTLGVPYIAVIKISGVSAADTNMAVYKDATDTRELLYVDNLEEGLFFTEPSTQFEDEFEITFLRVTNPTTLYIEGIWFIRADQPYWANGNIFERAPALTAVSRGNSPGPKLIMAKAIDIRNQESAEYRETVVDVDIDDFRILKTGFELAQNTVDSIDMTEVPSDEGRLWIADNSVTFNSLSSAINSYTDGIYAEFDGSQVDTYTWISTSVDLGEARTVTVEVGSAIRAGLLSNPSATTEILPVIQHSSDNSTWTDVEGSKAVVNNRYFRVKYSIDDQPLYVRLLPQEHLTITTKPKSESGSVTTAGSGATTVVLTRKYTQVQSINAYTEASTSYNVVVDNVQLGTPTTFDLYAFDSSNSQQAVTVNWTFRGV